MIFGLVASLILALLVSLTQAQETTECTAILQAGESIQALIDLAEEGAVICLAAGTWNENIKLEKPLTLRGDGEEPDAVRIVKVKFLGTADVITTSFGRRENF